MFGVRQAMINVLEGCWSYKDEITNVFSIRYSLSLTLLDSFVFENCILFLFFLRCFDNPQIPHNTVTLSQFLDCMFLLFQFHLWQGMSQWYRARTVRGDLSCIPFDCVSGGRWKTVEQQKADHMVFPYSTHTNKNTRERCALWWQIFSLASLFFDIHSVIFNQIRVFEELDRHFCVFPTNKASMQRFVVHTYYVPDIMRVIQKKNTQWQQLNFILSRTISIIKSIIHHWRKIKFWMIGSNEATPKQIRKNVERIGWIFIINKLEHLALAGVCLAAKFMKMNEEMVRATSDSLIYIYISWPARQAIASNNCPPTFNNWEHGVFSFALRLDP